MWKCRWITRGKSREDLWRGEFKRLSYMWIGSIHETSCKGLRIGACFTQLFYILFLLWISVSISDEIVNVFLISLSHQPRFLGIFFSEWLKIPRALSEKLAIGTRNSDLHTYRKYGYVGNVIKWRGQKEFSFVRLAGNKRKGRTNGPWTCWSSATNGSMLRRSRVIRGIVKR